MASNGPRDSDFPLDSEDRQVVTDALETGIQELSINESEDSISDSDLGPVVYCKVQDDLCKRLMRVEAKYRRAAAQIELLNRRLEFQHVRYSRANKEKEVAFRYFNRLKAATVEGVRHAFYMYARKLAEEMVFLRRLLHREELYVEDFINLPQDYDENLAYHNIPYNI